MNLYLRKENGFYIAEYSDMSWKPQYIIEACIDDVHDFLKKEPGSVITEPERFKVFKTFLEDNISSFKVGGHYVFSYNPVGMDHPPFKPWMISEKSDKHN